MRLHQVKAEFEKYIVVRDPHIFELIMATLVGNAIIPRDPLWVMICAPSSGGKTTLIAPCAGIKSCFFVDDMTSKTLLSGFKGPKGKETSLLKMIGSGVLVFSDFTSILTKNPTDRGEILTQLKLVYDRKLTKYTGLGMQEWNGKIGFLGAATPDIYSYLESGRSLGERFVYYWLDVPSDNEIADKQRQVKMSAKDITDAMSVFYAEYCKGLYEWVRVNGLPELSLTEEQRMAVRQAAIFCVNGKATVHTDFKTGRPDAMPHKAGIGRDIKMFEALLHTFQVMKCYEMDDPTLTVDDTMISIIRKCAYSSINRERRMILEILCAHNTPITSSQIGAVKGFGLPKESVEKYLIPLLAVGLIRKEVKSNRHFWYIDDEDTEIRDFMALVMGNVEYEVPEDQGLADIQESETKAKKDWNDLGGDNV